jgi:SH3-like domain-containing protein
MADIDRSRDKISTLLIRYMKTLTGLTLAAMLSAGAFAQAPPTPPPPPIPTLPSAPAPAFPAPPAPQPPAGMPAAAPATNLPDTKSAAVKKKKKKSVKKPATPAAADIMQSSPLVPNEPAAAKQNNVNVRDKAAINGDIVTRLKAGETVTVLELVTLDHPKTDEPAKWAKISLPARGRAWVNTAFLDANKAVKPAKLNVRGGPSENYGVIGLLHKGDVVKDVGTKGDWTQIEPPAGVYGFVAAHLLSHKEPEAPAPLPQPVVMPVVMAPPPVATPPPAPPTPAVVENQQPIAPPPTEPPAPAVPPVAPPPVIPPPPAPSVASVPAPLPPPVEDEPAPPRVVQRTGIVAGTVSIQAPSYFELLNLDNGKVMDYLYTGSTNVVLGRYKGKTVRVSGEEALDERWPNTPVITIEKIQVVQ